MPPMGRFGPRPGPLTTKIGKSVDDKKNIILAVLLTAATRSFKERLA